MFKTKSKSPEDMALVIAQLEIQLDALKGQKARLLVGNGSDEEVDTLTRSIDQAAAKIAAGTEELREQIAREVLAETSGAADQKKKLQAELDSTLETAGHHLGQCLGIISSCLGMSATIDKLRVAVGEYNDAPWAFRQGVSAGENETKPKVREFHTEMCRCRELAMADRDGLLQHNMKMERFNRSLAAARKAVR